MAAHPVIQRYRIAFGTGLAFTALAPVVGLYSPAASIGVFAAGAVGFGWARILVHPRFATMPQGMDRTYWRRLSLLVGAVGTPWVLIFFLLTLSTWAAPFSKS